MERCHCGRPLHYSDPIVQRWVEMIVAVLGSHMEVTINGRTWLVQRHYLALHGLRGADLPRLGFEEITPGRTPNSSIN